MNKLFLCSFALIALVGACKKDSNDHANSGGPLPLDQQAKVVVSYGNMLEAGYQDAYKTALDLQAKVKDFLANPTEQGFADAKTAWLAAREPYMQTEVGRFYGGPIDGDQGDGLLNSWPLDEGYIDYLVGDSHGTTVFGKPDFSTGIINMPEKFPTISSDILINNNQPDGGTTNKNGDNVSVSSGYHAIEFLLWGQDATPPQAKIPGQRSYKDYLTADIATAPNAARRSQYLQVATQLLVDDLKAMVDAWAPNTDNYRKKFEADVPAAIANMFNGIGRLAKGELAGERMGVPLKLHAQEQEHSCFSDNTHRDLILDMQGIVNAYNGKYTRTDGSTVSGQGLSDYVKAMNADDDNKMKSLLASAQSSLQNIEANKPFDFLIDGDNPSGNQIVQKGVTDVSAVADWISQIAHDLKLTQVNIPVENP